MRRAIVLVLLLVAGIVHGQDFEIIEDEGFDSFTGVRSKSISVSFANLPASTGWGNWGEFGVLYLLRRDNAGAEKHFITVVLSGEFPVKEILIKGGEQNPRTIKVVSEVMPTGGYRVATTATGLLDNNAFSILLRHDKVRMRVTYWALDRYENQDLTLPLEFLEKVRSYQK